jgi:hypothetical protein
MAKLWKVHPYSNNFIGNIYERGAKKYTNVIKEDGDRYQLINLMIIDIGSDMVVWPYGHW